MAISERDLAAIREYAQRVADDAPDLTPDTPGYNRLRALLAPTHGDGGTPHNATALPPSP